MAVTIGGVTFDGATGTPYPPLTASQLTSFAANAEAFRYGGTAPTGEGSMVAWADLDEADAQARLRAVSGLIGYVVSVVYPHGTVSGVAVANTTGEWQAKRGTVNGGVLVVRIDFSRSADREDGDTERTTVRVQTAAALAGPWTEEEGWAAFAGSDGLGTYAGESQATVAGQAPDPAKLGLWVRIVAKDADPVTSSDIEWVGVIVGASASARRDPANGIGWGASTVYRFAGLAHVLAQLFPTEWREDLDTSTSSPTPYQGTAPAAGHADIGTPLTFNADGRGNRGQTPVQLDSAPAPTVYLPARGLGDGGARWTAFQAARTCIAQIRRTVSTLPAINLADPDALLTYEGTWEVAKLSLLGMLDAIMSPAQARTFRLTVDWVTTPSTPAIVVTPIDLEDAGDAYDLTGDEIADWRCNFDAATQADQWWIDAGARSFMTTVEFAKTSPVNGVRGFSAAQETAWNTADANGREAVALSHVYHRFVLEPIWEGTDYLNAAALPYTRQVDGDGQETGELAAGGTYPQALVAWAIEHTLPVGAGQDWTAAYPTTLLSTDTPREGPLVYWRKSGQPLAAVHFTQQITVCDKVAGIEVGRDAAESVAIAAKFTAGFNLVATLSFVHPLTWRVSKLVTSPRTDAPRMAFTYLPADAFARVDVVGSAIVKVDGTGAPVHAAAGRRDGAASLTDVRDRFASWYTSPDGSAEWRRRSTTVRTPDPGSVVASIDVVLANGPPVVEATILIGSPVTRRVVSWDLYNPGITWSADRIVPALSGGGAALVAAGNGAVALGRGATAWKEGRRNA